MRKSVPRRGRDASRPLGYSAHRLPEALVVLETIGGEIQPHGDQANGLEADIRLQVLREPLRHECGAGNERERQRHFACDEPHLEAALPEPTGGTASILAEAVERAER